MIKRMVKSDVVLSMGRRCRIPIQTELTYDPDDPLAVKMAFSGYEGDEPNVWTVSRELLLRGCVSLVPHGTGDARMRYLGPNTNQLILCLKSNEGHADISLNQYQVVEFLNETCDAVRFGEETVGDQLDKFLEEVLGE